MKQLRKCQAKEELKTIQARIAALARGIQTQPENALDYAQALEVQLLLLDRVIHNLSERE